MKLHVTPSNFFSRIVRSEALVYNSFFFFQNSRFTEIIRLQTLQFLTRLPTRQDGFQNRDKAYTIERLEKHPRRPRGR